MFYHCLPPERYSFYLLNTMLAYFLIVAKSTAFLQNLFLIL